MVSSTVGEEGGLNKTKGLNRVLSASSKSISSTSSSSSSPSPFSSSTLLKNPRTTKTMEEVWKDITLASLQDQETTPRLTQANLTSNDNVILQDFLARPFSKDPPPSMVSTEAETAIYCPVSLVQPPATVLSLHSGTEFHFLDNSDPHRQNSLSQCLPISNVPPFSCPFEALDTSADLPTFGKKRVQEPETSSGDRRHKRMVKNRESAARSRARKQAYTNELELEVAHLTEENARLRKQQEQVKSDLKLKLVAAAPPPKKKSLQRTSTAPF